VHACCGLRFKGAAAARAPALHRRIDGAGATLSQVHPSSICGVQNNVLNALTQDDAVHASRAWILLAAATPAL
jgi:hypothetical protein